MKSKELFHKVIDELCKEKNIEQKKLSYGWIRELKKDEKIRHIIGYQFDLNSTASYKIASDKFATYEVLKENNISTIPHKIIFNSKTRSLYYKEEFIEEAIKLFDTYKKIVIKANDSYKGKDVYLCLSKQEIKNTILKLFNENKDTLSACPYLDIKYEYRVIYLNGKALYIYKKKKPYVIGDGIHTLEELIYNKFTSKKIELSLCKDIDFQNMPKKGEEITVSWKHNLSSGAEPVVINENEENINEIKKLAIDAAIAININFASIDIALTTDGEIKIMEINANVCMNKFIEIIPEGFGISKEIYSKAIDLMFDNK